MTPMMKIALLFSLLATAAAFSSPPAFVRTHTVAFKATAAEQHLETLLEEWNQLESELEAYKNRKDDLAAADLAEAMLTKALATARAKRDVDNEHIEASHKLYDEAMADELECEATLHIVEDEAVAAEHMVNMLETIDNDYEHLERVRDLSVAHAAHHQEQDIKAACANAEQVALKAKEEMLNAEESLHMLEKSEEELKAALKELHEARQDLQMRMWQQKE